MPESEFVFKILNYWCALKQSCVGSAGEGNLIWHAGSRLAQILSCSGHGSTARVGAVGRGCAKEGSGVGWCFKIQETLIGRQDGIDLVI